jgi:ABC-type amino acid transport system permease subunit
VINEHNVLENEHAADYLRWLNWGLWTVLAACIAAVIVGGATAYFAGHHTSSRVWGLRMVAAGLLGALSAPLLHQLIEYSWNLAEVSKPNLSL